MNLLATDRDKKKLYITVFVKYEAQTVTCVCNLSRNRQLNKFWPFHTCMSMGQYFSLAKCIHVAYPCKSFADSI